MTGLLEHIHLGKAIKLIFINFYQKDIELARFKIGQIVSINPQTEIEGLEYFRGRQDRIVGVSCVERNIVEYCVRYYPYLLLESEIEPIMLSPPRGEHAA